MKPRVTCDSDPSAPDPWETWIRKTQIHLIQVLQVSHELPVQVTHEDSDSWTSLSTDARAILYIYLGFIILSSPSTHKLPKKEIIVWECHVGCAQGEEAKFPYWDAQAWDA